MPLPPLLSTRLAVAALAVGVIVAASVAMRRLWPGTPSTSQLAGSLGRQFVADLRTRTHRAPWLLVLAWGTTHVALHYSWLATGRYTQFVWLDVLSHAMGGVGVAAIVLVGLRHEVTARVSGWWVVLLVLAVGAGFELYEFLFKTFWHHWTLTDYVHDTVLDLLVDVVGAVVVVAVWMGFPRSTIRQETS